MTTTEALAEYARLTAADIGEDLAAAIRAMRDKPGEVAAHIGCSPAEVIAWCETTSLSAAARELGRRGGLAGGAKGGAAKTPAKQAASRTNGALGGRPRMAEWLVADGEARPLEELEARPAGEPGVDWVVVRASSAEEAVAQGQAHDDDEPSTAYDVAHCEEAVSLALSGGE